MINIFSLFTKSDKINLGVSPILVKFNCILCKKNKYDNDCIYRNKRECSV